MHIGVASFTLSWISGPASLRCGHRGPPGPYRSVPASTALNRDTPCWTGVHRDVAPVVSTFLKPPCFTGTHRAVKQRRLIPGHQRSSSGMNRISTVRPPDETIANRHELCPRCTVQIRWLPAWRRCVREESRRRSDSCRSNYGLAW